MARCFWSVGLKWLQLGKMLGQPFGEPRKWTLECLFWTCFDHGFLGCFQPFPTGFKHLKVRWLAIRNRWSHLYLNSVPGNWRQSRLKLRCTKPQTDDLTTWPASDPAGTAGRVDFAMLQRQQMQQNRVLAGFQTQCFCLNRLKAEWTNIELWCCSQYSCTVHTSDNVFILAREAQRTSIFLPSTRTLFG